MEQCKRITLLHYCCGKTSSYIVITFSSEHPRFRLLFKQSIIDIRLLLKSNPSYTGRSCAAAVEPFESSQQIFFTSRYSQKKTNIIWCFTLLHFRHLLLHANKMDVTQSSDLRVLQRSFICPPQRSECRGDLMWKDPFPAIASSFSPSCPALYSPG